MIALAVLGPVAFIGLIAWIAAGIRQRQFETFTMASGAALYASLMTILGVTMALLGIEVGVKVLIGFINMSYAYSAPVTSLSGSSTCIPDVTAPTCPTAQPPDLTPQRTDDLALAIALFAIGVLVFLLHRLIARSARRFPGGLPAWVQRGTVLAFAVLYAPTAVILLVAAVHGVVSYVIAPPATSGSITAQPAAFGDLIGAVAAFLPAWIMTLIFLIRRFRWRAPVPPPATAPAPSIPPP